MPSITVRLQNLKTCIQKRDVEKQQVREILEKFIDVLYRSIECVVEEARKCDVREISVCREESPLSEYETLKLHVDHYQLTFIPLEGIGLDLEVPIKELKQMPCAKLVVFGSMQEGATPILDFSIYPSGQWWCEGILGPMFELGIREDTMKSFALSIIEEMFRIRAHWIGRENLRFKTLLEGKPEKKGRLGFITELEEADQLQG